MKVVLVFLLCCCPLFMTGQSSNEEDKPVKDGTTVALPDMKSNESKINISPSTPQTANPNTNIPDLLTIKPDPNKIQMIPETTLRNPGEIYAKRFNKKPEKEEQGFKSDQFLGEFRSNGKFAEIIYRDHDYVDGDRVRIYVNEIVIEPNALLTGKFKGFNIGLESGFNVIEFEALNQGSSGPNTAELQVYDDRGNLISANRWNLTTGVKAKLIIIKQ